MLPQLTSVAEVHRLTSRFPLHADLAGPVVLAVQAQLKIRLTHPGMAQSALCQQPRRLFTDSNYCQQLTFLVCSSGFVTKPERGSLRRGTAIFGSTNQHLLLRLCARTVRQMCARPRLWENVHNLMRLRLRALQMLRKLRRVSREAGSSPWTCSYSQWNQTGHALLGVAVLAGLQAALGVEARTIHCLLCTLALPR